MRNLIVRTAPGRTSLAVLSLLALASLALITGCGGAKEEGEGAAADTAPATIEYELTEDWLYSRAASKIGSASLVRSISITGPANDKVIKVEVDRPELCHDGAVVGTMAVFTQNIMGILYKKFPEVADVEVVMYGVEQGVISDDIAMSVSVDREAASNIDWFEFDEKTITTLSSEYYMDPVIEESYRLEGGLPYDQQ